MHNATTLMVSYNFFMVGLSYAIAVLNAYTAFEQASRIATSHGRIRTIWLVCGALTLGSGIWAMHFTGMLTFNHDMSTSYDVTEVILSLLIAIAVSGVALYAICQAAVTFPRLLMGGTILGLGIGGMHYLGMRAMRMQAVTIYDPWLVTLSIGIAIGVSILALTLTFSFRHDHRRTLPKIVGAFVMGGAIAGAHYTGMAAATFIPIQFSSMDHGIAVEVLGSGIGLTTLLTLGIILFLALVGRGFAEQIAAFESVFMCHPDAVYALTLDGTIKHANPAATRLTGHSHAELVGVPLTALITTDARAQTQNYLVAAAHGTAQQYETTVRHCTGQLVFVIVTSVPMIVDQQIVGLYGLVKNITKRTLAQQERTRLATILEATTDFVGTANADGQILYGNRAVRMLMGWDADADLVGYQLDAIIAPHMHDQLHTQTIPTAMRQGVWSGESAVIRSDNEEIPISQVMIAHRNPDGSVAFLSSIMRDMRERKQIESLIEADRVLLAERVEARTAELNAANVALARSARLKDDFLASMSHELRTPLNVVLGLAESLEEGIYGPINTEQLMATSGIIASSYHLQALINDILDLSKIEAGTIVLQYETVDVATLCAMSIQLIRPFAEQKQITLSLTGDLAVTTMQGDPRRLKQMLVNLLRNAVKFTPLSGLITLQVSADIATQQVHFRVDDTGIGIAPEDLSRLFQPFVQLDSSLARHYAGTGLGLALVAGMTRLHGGSVSVTSAVGIGSQFRISLPWNAPDSNHGHDDCDTTHRTPALQPRTDSATILLAEDNELNIIAFTDYLVGSGYRVVVARTGIETLEMMPIIRPDLIVMDIQLPEIDGWETIRLIRANSALAQTPIVAVTALAMPGDEDRCLQAGATTYLSKPVHLRTMADVIATHLRKTPSTKETCDTK